MKNKHSDLMINLNNHHHKLLEIIDSKNVIYLDIPIYSNVGDLLIMHGTLEFFRANKIKCKHIFSAYNFNPKLINKDTIFIFQGGGNFGDLYQLHQKFREKIIKEFPNNKIILLPQTIFFGDENNYKICCDKFSEHKNLHICTRDEKSYELSKKMTDKVYLMPDMAHNLYPLKSKVKVTKDLLCFKRIDKEANSDMENIVSDTISDWDLLLEKYSFEKRIYLKIISILNKFNMVNLSAKLWTFYTNILINRSICLFKTHRKIYTNRLHGHILSCLLDIENTVYDNSYGKNSSYINIWTKNSPLVQIKDFNEK